MSGAITLTVEQDRFLIQKNKAEHVLSHAPFQLFQMKLSKIPRTDRSAILEPLTVIAIHFDCVKIWTC